MAITLNIDGKVRRLEMNKYILSFNIFYLLYTSRYSSYVVSILIPKGWLHKRWTTVVSLICHKIINYVTIIVSRN